MAGHAGGVDADQGLREEIAGGGLAHVVGAGVGAVTVHREMAAEGGDDFNATEARLPLEPAAVGADLGIDLVVAGDGLADHLQRGAGLFREGRGAAAVDLAEADALGDLAVIGGEGVAVDEAGGERVQVLAGDDGALHLLDVREGGEDAELDSLVVARADDVAGLGDDGAADRPVRGRELLERRVGDGHARRAGGERPDGGVDAVVGVAAAEEGLGVGLAPLAGALATEDGVGERVRVAGADALPLLVEVGEREEDLLADGQGAGGSGVGEALAGAEEAGGDLLGAVGVVDAVGGGDGGVVGLIGGEAGGELLAVGDVKAEAAVLEGRGDALDAVLEVGEGGQAGALDEDAELDEEA